jgi:CIC family chloride channel protein
VVVDAKCHVIGVVTEKHARRRYFEKIELSQRELLGKN